MDYFTTSQFGLNNDYYWSNAEYNKLAVEQASTVDPQQRKDIIWHMQQIMYAADARCRDVYSDDLEAINTAKWAGWTQMFGGSGPAWNGQGNIASYLTLRPAVQSTTTSGRSSTTLIVVILVAVIVVAGVALVFVRRRSRRQVDDEA